MKQLMYCIVILTAYCSIQAMSNQSSFDKELFNAVHNNDILQVKQLIDAGANVNTSDDSGYMPLHKAVQQGHSGIIKVLLDAGCNVNAVVKNVTRNTALHIAVNYDHKESVKLLLEAHVNVNITNTFNETALHAAVFKSSTAIVKLLLNTDADSDVHAPSWNKETPLSWAMSLGNTDIIDVLKQYMMLESRMATSPKEVIDTAIRLGHLILVKKALQKVVLTVQDLGCYNQLLQSLYKQTGDKIYQSIGKQLSEYALGKARIEKLIKEASCAVGIAIPYPLAQQIAIYYAQTNAKGFLYF
ncbi:ankyrin repeat domain-containing protein [Candidatus Dependentiae bacterium]|nr:ankyrin repeat domain-containing protein [Candidatus Dependentiae bacterium]